MHTKLKNAIYLRVTDVYDNEMLLIDIRYLQCDEIYFLFALMLCETTHFLLNSQVYLMKTLAYFSRIIDILNSYERDFLGQSTLNHSNVPS